MVVCSIFYSVQFSHSVVSDSLRPLELQHARPPCPSPTPGVHPNSCPSSQWCHPAISSSAVPFSSCPQSLPASESFPMSQCFTSGGQSTGVLALFSMSPSNEHPGLISFRMDWLDLLAVQGTLKSLLQHHSSKPSISPKMGLQYTYLVRMGRVLIGWLFPRLLSRKDKLLIQAAQEHTLSNPAGPWWSGRLRFLLDHSYVRIPCPTLPFILCGIVKRF